MAICKLFINFADRFIIIRICLQTVGHSDRYEVNLLTVFLEKVKNAETLETNSVRQQLFDNLQPNLKLDTDVKVQDMEDRCKQLIISMDVYVLSTNKLLQRYLSCNLSCNHESLGIRKVYSKAGYR